MEQADARKAHDRTVREKQIRYLARTLSYEAAKQYPGAGKMRRLKAEIDRLKAFEKEEPSQTTEASQIKESSQTEEK